MDQPRQPTIFLPHGGGPWPFVDVSRFMSARDVAALRGFLEGLPGTLPAPPKALLVVSAHWEETEPTVMTSPRPPMLYDYGGFPPAAYTLTWPAPGEPALAARVVKLLGDAGIAAKTDARRGFDHGTFVPCKVAWPEADIPTIQLSLKAGLDPAQHLAIGRALAPLRDEGVLILGSGMSYHNLRDLGTVSARAASIAFGEWFKAASIAAPETRARELTAWRAAPSARHAHPREEHLLPAMVVAGAGGDDAGRIIYDDEIMNVRVSAVQYG
jgi:aromatic ring-opening dioxygenase catalytic subunit (LigB family)